jgi:eukaryotic-like serine/threonine-protein kinase
MADSLERLAAALGDRYRIERELGQGGMATVYLAADLKHDRKVAIKVLKPELAAVLGAERFVQEIKTTAALNHPHILPLFDSGETGGFLYYVMPYIEGETIRDKLSRETQFGIEEAVRITTAVADALDYAHRNGVIHRDIKPENILLHDGRPMVMDFGIALAVSAAAGGRMTETGLSLGTPHYMSPEQATADKQITARSDVYSLASVLYEMLAGEPPHMGNSAQAIIMKIITERAKPVTELRTSVPPHVAAAVAHALEKLPADRFDSAKAFAEALRNPSFATAATTGRSAVPPHRRTALVPALAAIAIVTTALATWGWLRAGRGAGSVGVVRFSVPLATDTGGAANGAAIARFAHTRLAFSPDGSRLAYSARGPQTNSSLYERRVDRDAAEVLRAGSDTAYIWPFFSPDGAWLGFVAWADDGRYMQLRRMSLADQSVETIASIDTLGITGFTWGDDGTIVAAARGLVDRLVRIPASGGEWEVLAQADTSPGVFRAWNQPYMLPGSKTLLFHAARSFDPKRSDIVALDIATGEQHTVLANAMNPIYANTGHLLFLREGTLMGVGFDPEHARVRGQPVVLIGDVMQSLYGGNTAQETGAAQVALSPAGHLAYARGGVGQAPRSRVIRVTARGDTIPIAMEHRDWILFRLSPDGGRLAAISRRGQDQQIWIHDLTRGVTQALNTGGYQNWPLAWSPDGQSILFTSDRDQPGRADLYRMPADGSGAPERLAPSDRDQSASDWSSRGVIAYLQEGDVWVIPPDSEARPFFTTSEATEGWPTFSPDGRWLAYASNQTGRFEVYVRPYPAAEPATLVSTAGGSRPLWSRDGRTLFYDDDSTLMAVDVAPGAEFRPGRARRYLAPWYFIHFFTRGHDVFPDGSIVFAVNDPDAPVQPWGASEIQVILNFANELRERVGK